MFRFQTALRDQATDCAGVLLSDWLVTGDQQELGRGWVEEMPFNLLFLLQKKKKDTVQLKDVLLQSQLRYAVDK